MIELTLLEFHEQQYREQQYCLYVVKNGNNDILYVGISINNIWERWFAWGSHMTWDGKVIYGESPIGVKVENHLPDSKTRPPRAKKKRNSNKELMPLMMKSSIRNNQFAKHLLSL